MRPSIKQYTSSRLAGGLFALCLLMSGTQLSAQEKQRTTPTAAQQNIHTDQQWTKEAFTSRMSEAGVYPNWLDQDSLLTREAFNTGIFNRWDTDRDGNLTEDEYVAGSIAWGEEYSDNFDAWDVGGEGYLTEEEFGAGMDETGLYDSWDIGGEGYLTEEEFSEGLFNTLDADGDGSLTDGEFSGEGYDTWFDADVDGEGTGTGIDIDPTGGTGTGIDGGTDIDTGTDTGTDIGTGGGIGTGTETGSGGGTGTAGNPGPGR